MIVKLLTAHHLEFLSLKEGCTGSSESRLVKLPHCWKSHVTAHSLMSVIVAFPGHTHYSLVSSSRIPSLVQLFYENIYLSHRHMSFFN